MESNRLQLLKVRLEQGISENLTLLGYWFNWVNKFNRGLACGAYHRNIDSMKEKLCNEWIGAIASPEQNEYYAKKLIEFGFDTVKIIENNLDFEEEEGRYVDALDFMDPVHKEVFIQNVSNIMKENDNETNGKSNE